MATTFNMWNHIVLPKLNIHSICTFGWKPHLRTFIQWLSESFQQATSPHYVMQAEMYRVEWSPMPSSACMYTTCRQHSHCCSSFTWRQIWTDFSTGYRTRGMPSTSTTRNDSFLTLSVCMEYIYSVASQATSPAPFKYLFNKYPYWIF
jgi:hypothetical protein